MNEILFAMLDDDSSAQLEMVEMAWSGPLADPLRVAYRERMVCWILRIYTGAHGMPAYTGNGDVNLRSVARLLEVPVLADPQASSHQVREALQAAAHKAQVCPEDGSTLVGPQHTPEVGSCCLRRNIEWIAAEVGLSALETEILDLACALWVFKTLRIAQDIWGDLTSRDVANAVSALIQYPRAGVDAALRHDARLAQSGLLLNTREAESTLHDMLRVPRRLLLRLVMPHSDPAGVLELIRK